MLAECPILWVGMNAAVLNPTGRTFLSCTAFSPRLESLGYT